MAPAQFQSGFLLLVVLMATASIQTTIAQPSIKIEAHEGKPCKAQRDCDSPNTLMQCSSLQNSPYQCMCFPFRLGFNNATQPYFNKDAGKCVIRAGQACALPDGGSDREMYQCEPDTTCEPNDAIRLKEIYGYCTAAGPRTTSAGFSVHALLVLILSATLLNS